MGIYKIEKEKRVRVKVRTGAMVRNKYGGDHVRGKFCFFSFAFFCCCFLCGE